ncbi:MAG: transcriptional regulator [Pseudomonadota bacterium]
MSFGRYTGILSARGEDGSRQTSVLASHTARRVRASVFALMAATAVAACSADVPKHLKPLPYSTINAMEKRGLTKEDPILIRIYKEEGELEVWKKAKADGKFRKFRSYDICKWSGNLGPKFFEGDRQAPEGFYTVTPALMNPNSSYHLSFNLGFPNAFDRSHGRTGSHLMVHGACSSAGCYAMEDDQIEEIYSLAREAFDAGQKGFQVHAFPFRMTAENLARHAGHEHLDFWRMLKYGNDHFEVTKKAPEIAVCDRRYVFNPDGTYNFDPQATCPNYAVPEVIRTAVAEKQAEDTVEEQVVLARLQKKNGVSPVFDVIQDPSTGQDVMVADAETPAIDPADADPLATATVAAPEQNRRGLLSRFRQPAAPESLAPATGPDAIEAPADAQGEGEAPVPAARPQVVEAETAEEAVSAALNGRVVSERWASPLPVLTWTGRAPR